MPLTIKELHDILGGELYDAKNKENNIINNFENWFPFIHNKNTAYISPNKKTWRRFGRSPNAKEGNEYIRKDKEDLGLIITEHYVSNMSYKIPQLVVKDSAQTLSNLAEKMRIQYKNPVIAITGSMGKSSTRMLISAGLKDYMPLQNRYNNNIRSAVYLLLCKLIRQPNFAVLEVSLNALNAVGNSSYLIKPNIAIVTGIGAAHMSTFKDILNIVEVKASIFDGLDSNGIAIINKDTLHSDILINRAKENTKNVITYSTSDSNATIYPKSIEYNKGFTDITVEFEGNEYTYRINSISNGMVENSLASFAALTQLNIPLQKALDNLITFKPFEKVLNLKEIKTSKFRVNLIDDTHNASLPAMINAIKAFDTQTKFFKGNKIIAIGKISDLGKHSRKLHLQLVNVLENSNADYILCMDDDLKGVVTRVKNKHITWYSNRFLMEQDLLYLCNNDSITLLKSSAGGTEFPKLAKDLSNNLLTYQKDNSNSSLFDGQSINGRSYIIVNNNDYKIIEQYNSENSSTIEGLGPIFNYLKGIDDNIKNETVTIGNWATNNNIYYEGKETSTYNLMKDMLNSPMYSPTYELSKYLFKNGLHRDEYIDSIIKKLDLSNSVAINLTGRHTIKERQSFTVNDLYSILKSYKDNLFKFSNKIIIGRKYKSGIIKGDKQSIIFTSYPSVKTIETLFHSKY
ncbi:Mur ligase family protein [Staphylococcus hominis]|uniref:Mur ligase family protein n=1 Tax=Staphylococcus hominis TaxID=1290 RepID=UPI0012AAE6A8|nr:Mur ligase family protein [Staphylococcus hominis]